MKSIYTLLSRKIQKTNDYSKPLDNDEWSAHYNIDSLNSVVNAVSSNNVSIWSEELVKICPEGTSTLEIGCGSGASSLWLAKNGRNVAALDYTESSVELVRAAACRLGFKDVNVVHCDAAKELPFGEKQFDYIFQAGLLEHFETDEQIRLLRNWAKYGKYMISMIPNASSIPYRVGKQIMENNGTWEYGLEIPKHSLREEFTRAGITVEKEYTIGSRCAQNFLPKRHFIKKFFAKLEKDGYNLDDLMQGYLLVTIGKCD